MELKKSSEVVCVCFFVWAFAGVDLNIPVRVKLNRNSSVIARRDPADILLEDTKVPVGENCSVLDLNLLQSVA